MRIRSGAPLLRHPIAIAVWLSLAIGSCGAAARAQDSVAAPPSETEIQRPVGFVNDLAGVIDEPSRAKLEGFLDQVKRKTGAEFAVLTVRTTAPITPSEYKVQVFQRWGLGEKGKDNGLLMLVAIEEREVRFETGYGLEGTLPDGLQSRIFRQVMAPRFRQDDYSGGIVAGVLEVAARIAKEQGVTLEWNGQELRYSGRGGGQIPGWVIALIVFAVILSMAGGGSRRRRGRGIWWGGGGGFGGWGGGFGGFGGGGGGGGFGGFGGGGSGGGGGGGRW